MVRVAVTLCVNGPDVPVKVRVCVPVEAPWLTVIVIVDCAEPEALKLTCVGESAQVVLPGTPLHDSDTASLYSPTDVAVNV